MSIISFERDETNTSKIRMCITVAVLIGSLAVSVNIRPDLIRFPAIVIFVASTILFWFGFMAQTMFHGLTGRNKPYKPKTGVLIAELRSQLSLAIHNTERLVDQNCPEDVEAKAHLEAARRHLNGDNPIWGRNIITDADLKNWVNGGFDEVAAAQSRALRDIDTQMNDVESFLDSLGSEEDL